MAALSNAHWKKILNAKCKKCINITHCYLKGSTEFSAVIVGFHKEDIFPCQNVRQSFVVIFAIKLRFGPRQLGLVLPPKKAHTSVLYMFTVHI